METKTVDKQVSRHYCVRLTTAESGDREAWAPKLTIDTFNVSSLQAARIKVQEWLGMICRDSGNRVDWVDWGSNLLRVQYARVDGARVVERSILLEIFGTDNRPVVYENISVAKEEE